jgi:hypothetical protein
MTDQEKDAVRYIRNLCPKQLDLIIAALRREHDLQTKSNELVKDVHSAFHGQGKSLCIREIVQMIEKC